MTQLFRGKPLPAGVALSPSGEPYDTITDTFLDVCQVCDEPYGPEEADDMGPLHDFVCPTCRRDGLVQL